MPNPSEYDTVTTPYGTLPLLQAERVRELSVAREAHSKLPETSDVHIEALGAQATRVFWAFSEWTSSGNGSHIITDTLSVLGSLSQVACSITEITPSGGPFIALAGMAVYNVAPRDGGFVDVHWWVGWDAPLRIRLNYIIVP